MPSSLATPDTLTQAHAATPAPTLTESDSASLYIMPATQGQGRFWSLDQLTPGHPGLNMPLMWQFTGPLDIILLRGAFQACVERHEMLRTTFGMAEGRLSQFIRASARVDLPFVDLSTLSGEAQRVEADRLTKLHASMRMDLRRGPLLHLQLLRLGSERHLLLLNMHHIICDGISLGILMRDMLAFYEGALEHTETALPALPIQFGDYAVWQEEWRKSEEADASRAFWHETLGRDFQTVTLPQDGAPTESLPPEGSHTGDIETLLIPRDLTARAHAFCLSENVTFNMLLFSTFVAMVARITGRLQFTIGSPCANRTEDTEELIGLFMNIQVFRSHLQEDTTFRELLEQVRAWTLGAYENQTLPFEDLVHDPFFAEGADAFQIPVFFLYQKSFMLQRRIGELQVVPLRSESPGAVFDVMFAIVDRAEEGPRLQLEFNPQKHTASTVQRWLRLYINLLESGISSAEEHVLRLPAMSAAERRSLLVEANETARDFGPFRSLPDQFLAQVKRSPASIALVCEGQQVSYAQLSARTQALAQQLATAGLLPGEPVAICVHRSIEMVVAMLAVLYAGGAYVPLDPRHPRERLEHVLADSRARLVLHSGSCDVSVAAQKIDVRTASAPADDLEPAAVAPDSLAYIIYTSGTTGVPKGVAIEHGSLANLLNTMREQPGLDTKDVLVAITTPSFDIAAAELFLPLVTGAQVVIATEQQVQSPPASLALLQQSGATVMQATPGAWHALIDAGWDSRVPLKVLCGGDTMSRPLAEKLLERSDDVWNMYGPTETTVWSAVTRVQSSTETPRLGKPMANTQLFVLDERLQPVPVGFAGELYIGGAGLARGYWMNPELTAERFIANPFGAGRLYRTGDLARWNPDRTVDLLGRADFQIKVRGYRIELGDVESALLRQPGVREAVVLQHCTADTDAHRGDERLLAYVEAQTGAAPSARFSQVLSDALRRTLPEYMVPHHIVVLPQLPRTPHGKIDRRALSALLSTSMAGEALTDEEPFVPARDALERQLQQIWQTTLGLDSISMRASFFSLGASSLAALRLVTKINRTFATDFGLATLLSAPTIEGTAELIRNRFAPNTDSPLVAIKPAGSRPPLFMVHGIGGNVISFHGLAMRLGDDQPVYGIQAQGLLANEAGLLRLEDMAAQYVHAIRSVQPTGPYHFLGYSFGGTVVMEMAHQLRAAGEQVALVGMLDAKSTVYWQAIPRSVGVNTRVNQRLERFRGNTGQLDRTSRHRYIFEKLQTRALRFAYRAAAALGTRRVPARWKHAEELNRVAVKRYSLKPYEGKLHLFRASEQHDGVDLYDLGWSGFFADGIIVRELPGDHERVFLEPMVEELVQAIRETLTDMHAGVGADERAE